MPLVKVTWIDAATHGGPGWVDLDDAKEWALEPCPVMETVGFLLHVDEDDQQGYLTLTDTLGSQECASVHKIPNCMILDTERPYESL
tara:strand:- start:1091 stop:1351 length:261 start_codon:yes stop_codon:yes gene_type:complete